MPAFRIKILTTNGKVIYVCQFLIFIADTIEKSVKYTERFITYCSSFFVKIIDVCIQKWPFLENLIVFFKYVYF